MRFDAPGCRAVLPLAVITLMVISYVPAISMGLVNLRT
jgi:hypothetical protein